MITVAEAQARMLQGFAPLGVEQVSLAAAAGRVLAEDVRARRSQPPMAVSAMDGYAVRAADVARVPATLTCIGAAPAGAAFAGQVGPGQAVRIFTGAPVPDGADTIVIQEDVDAEGASLRVREGAPVGHYVRPRGLDFQEGQVCLAAGRVLSARDVGLAATMNVPWLKVRRRPRVALLATGNEVVMPGDPLGPNQIVSSNTLALAALVHACGGEAMDLGIALDTRESLIAAADGAARADLLVTTGGASVGEHDLVQSALGQRGLVVDFWRIAMRPGKPLMFGRLGDTPMLGLPGNPVSTVVCGLLFLRPALAHMLGHVLPPERRLVRLGRDMPANDGREDYVRATLARGDGGEDVATPFPVQDSSMMRTLAQADCLIVRPIRAPAARAGDRIEMLPLDIGMLRC